MYGVPRIIIIFVHLNYSSHSIYFLAPTICPCISKLNGACPHFRHLPDFGPDQVLGQVADLHFHAHHRKRPAPLRELELELELEKMYVWSINTVSAPVFYGPDTRQPLFFDILN